jgi:hypothetical protein
MKPVLRQRNFTDDLTPLDLDYRVERYSKAAIGGPKLAEITATGADADLWRLLELLRCPVEIYGAASLPVWWGYVAGVRLTVRAQGLAARPRMEVAATLDGMSNRIAVAYTNVDVSTGMESRQTTDWADGLESQAEYGTKELLWSADAATTEHAEAARDAKLSQDEYPIPTISPTDAGESRATITCRGWWDTLGWLYYANVGETAVDTAEQVESILTAKGQFFEGVWRDVSSGILIRETRDGDATALYEAEKLLAMGTTNYRRMLAEVDPTRRVRIYEEPTRPANPYLLSPDGSITDGLETPIRSEICPVGVWVRLKGVMPASLNATLLADPSNVFIEESEYDASRDRLNIRGRGWPDPWEFPRVKDG